jgi:MoxR-like ATPase
VQLFLPSRVSVWYFETALKETRVITTAAKLEQLQERIEGVIRGKSDVVRLAITALVAGGHLLVEDVPGVGKTTLAQALARSFDCSFRRIQFTSDLLPSDVIGLTVYNQIDGSFEYRRGPIFANFILADEINRTTPKTQSALLEAMAENHVTVENETLELPRPFMVIATQNPVEYHGTYPLPESQLDRFLMRVRMGYPSFEDEKDILRRHVSGEPVASVEPIMSSADVLEMQAAARRVRVDDALADYLLRVVKATRDSEILDLGVSPRASLALYHTAQAIAFVEGRDYCIADDIKSVVVPVLAHRVVVSSRYSTGLRRSDEAETALREIVRGVDVPL